MAILSIRKYPDPVVREATNRVESIDSDINSLIKSMIDTMYDAPGIGLAANQIGVQKSVIVVDIDDKPRAFINPEIAWASDETTVDEEGCLSLIPDIHVPIERPAKLVVRALDNKGRPVEIEAEGLLARVFGHEIDHLNGGLIIDRASEEDRKKILQTLFNIP